MKQCEILIKATVRQTKDKNYAPFTNEAKSVLSFIDTSFASANINDAIEPLSNG